MGKRMTDAEFYARSFPASHQPYPDVPIVVEEAMRARASEAELLEALRALLAAYEGAMHSEYDTTGDVWSADGRGDTAALAARAAIAKATGGES